ncbi:biotin--[acetyl-CoA-carboxylase] ligase [Spirochaeta isovalerica]|uniref:biotin--[biotin carboxyl-carrier protein] ligase n=1 Tax=Spirochaeta isovalerica TaxID=150 RepID=A0A841RH20_9SPIO|nr:biotin--[acetyl-CoA-carboxylase] ligase [Spirochaeta isovalerica]MBB6482497.1 BirA family biotin operon repressor/biotin-[acetyl-CoA-carboxylase] ligase [Spirochaeta isovalerica]
MEIKNLQNPFPDAPVYYRDVTDSTMEDSKKSATAGILHGTVFSTEFQEKGRGRIRGRRWHSGKGQNLMFTLVLRRDHLTHELHHLPLIAGAALLDAATRFTGEAFSLKWPNDLIFGGRKCAGILCEADSTYFYCGMGINCNQENFPPEIEYKTTSLREITRRNIDRDDFLVEILGSFKNLLDSGDLWISLVEKFLYLSGETIEVRDGWAGSEDIVRGINRGIGNDGQLLIEEESGIIREIYAGEIEI